MNSGLKVFLGIAVISILRKSVSALDVVSVEEGSCDSLQNVTQPDVDMNWIGSVPTWFLVVGSKHHHYRMSGYHLSDENLEDVPEYRFYYDSCLTLNTDFTAGISNVSGYGLSRQTTMNVTLVGPGIIDYQFMSSSVGRARHFITLTDNQSWLFLTNCELNTNLRSWNVISTLKTLDAQTIDRIEQHAIAQGFNPTNFVRMRFDTCDMSTVSGSSEISTTTTAPPATTTTPTPTTAPQTTTTTVPVPNIPWAPQPGSTWYDSNQFGGKIYGLERLFNKDFGQQKWFGKSHFANKWGNGKQNKLFGGFHANKWTQKQNNGFGGLLGGPVGNNWFGNAQFQQLPNGTWLVGGVSPNGTWFGGAFHPNGTWIGGVPQNGLSNGFPLWNQR